jgi:hypothetical protein
MYLFTDNRAMSYLSRAAGRLLPRAAPQRSFSASVAVCDTPTHTGQTFSEDDPRLVDAILMMKFLVIGPKTGQLIFSACCGVASFYVALGLEKLMR